MKDVTMVLVMSDRPEPFTREELLDELASAGGNIPIIEVSVKQARHMNDWFDIGISVDEQGEWTYFQSIYGKHRLRITEPQQQQ